MDAGVALLQDFFAGLHNRRNLVAKVETLWTLQMETNGTPFPASNSPEHPRGGPGQSDMQRQLDALNMAERIRSSSVSSAAGNVANSSAPMLPPPPSNLSHFLAQANPSIGPLFFQDEVRGKPVLLRMIAELYNRKGTPLPPALTGVQSPAWNPVTTPFRFDLGTEKGVIKLAGQDVDLFKLWQILFAAGLSSKVTRDGAWPQITQQIGLPPTMPDGTPTSNQVQSLSAIYTDLEMFLVRLMQNQARRQQQSASNPQGPQSVAEGETPSQGFTPQAMIGTPAASAPTPTATTAGGGAETPAPGSASDDSDSRKRKAEDDDDETKRAKFRKIEEDGATVTPTTGAMDADNEPSTSAIKEEPQPEGPLLRRKIEYMPVMRTINTYGGRDLDAIEGEFQLLPRKRPMRKMEDFGMVDIEALILQLRSRLKIEVTTALGLLYHLAFLRGGERGNSGLQLSVCEDLTDELLDLLEETAFGDVRDVDNPEDADIKQRIVTNRELARNLQDEGDELFAGVKADQRIGPLPPTHQPWEVVMLITTILTTVASADENPGFLGSRPRVLDLFMRLCMLHPSKDRREIPKASSPVLQLRHVLRIRKDVVGMLGVIARYVRLSDSPPRATRRLYLLLASTLMDSDECISPSIVGRLPSQTMDTTLDTFTQIIHPDYNRKVISAEIPWESLWTLMMTLTRILPFTDVDIQNVVSDVWMSFVFKAAHAIYSLAVAAPLPMRRKMKSSTSLRGALARYLKMGTTTGTVPNVLHRTLSQDIRSTVEDYWKRMGETLKVIDAEEDPLAPTSSAGGLIGYGIGGSYDLHLGAKPPARGTGMFGGNRQELLWSVLLTSAVHNDNVAFEEWDYMLRVDSSTSRV